MLLTLNIRVFKKHRKQNLTNRLIGWIEFRVLLDSQIILKIRFKTINGVEVLIHKFVEQVQTLAKQDTPATKEAAKNEV